MTVNKSYPEPVTAAFVLNDVSELLAYALALEDEAYERYAELAGIMETHNNKDIAKLLLKMSRIEKLHADHIRQLISNYRINNLPVRRYQWLSPEGPESIDPGDLHYLITANQALGLALYNEKRAYDFYRNIATHTPDPETRQLAQELAEEEEEHVEWVQDWLNHYPDMEENWDYDDDPPVDQD